MVAVLTEDWRFVGVNDRHDDLHLRREHRLIGTAIAYADDDCVLPAIPSLEVKRKVDEQLAGGRNAKHVGNRILIFDEAVNLRVDTVAVKVDGGL